MSYKLIYPYTEEERTNFIVEYNHNQGLRIETVDNFVDIEVEIETEDGEVATETKQENMPTYYALEANEIMVDDEPVVDPEFEEKEAQKERNRVAKLYLTAADVERGIYQAKGTDFEDIIALVTRLQPEEIDVKALKIELKANNFYRGNPYVNTVGQLLGFSDIQLDKFFEDGNYEHLLV